MTEEHDLKVFKIMTEEHDLKVFNTWRKDVSKNLPDLATRIFDLRTKSYLGCGFHYALEVNLGWVISSMNDFNTSYRNFLSRLAVRVRYKLLVKRIEEIEFERKSIEYKELFINPLTI